MDLKEIASKIKLLAFDVDGVMTDGSITYDEMVRNIRLSMPRMDTDWQRWQRMGL